MLSAIRRTNVLSRHFGAVAVASCSSAVSKVSKKTVTMAEVRKHDDEHDCWVVINNRVYDVTAFMADHPGGVTTLMRAGGTDATEDFEMLHPPNTLEKWVHKVVFMGELTDDTSV